MVSSVSRHSYIHSRVWGVACHMAEHCADVRGPESATTMDHLGMSLLSGPQFSCQYREGIF